MGFWKKIGKAIMTAVTLLNIKSEKVCFQEYGIGCFSNAKPFDNAGGKLPQSPAVISVSFLLYTRQNKLVAETIRNTEASIKASRYNGLKETKIIIHGFRDDGRDPWVKSTTAAILKKEDVNVIVVDWEKGADGGDYNRAAANSRVVGALLAQLMKSLVLYKNAKVKDMHLIGHSLGAHVAGYAGSRTPGTGRITGLDPAGPLFDNQDVRVRLDPKDALFVDVIHTDGEPITALGFGTSRALGDVDFYPNDGKNQPGCKPPGKVISLILKGKIKEFTRGISCSHSRALDLFIESISNSCVFTAHPCKSYSDFQAGKCPCNNNCVAMGYYADKNAKRGRYYLSTNLKAPFCKK